MSSQRSAGRAAKPVRVGLFGRLASGNIGNDASMEAILAYLRAQHPAAIVDAMCNGPERMRAHYGIDATQLFHEHVFPRRPSRPVRAAWLAWEKLVDAARIAAWVRAHDVVIIPGMGVLEAYLPIDPWGMPYSQYLLAAWGRIFRTKVAMVNVGAGRIGQRSTRWLFSQSARLAYYLSFRDVQSREAMAEQGLDTSRIPIYPDLAFAIPVPPYDPGEERTVGIGVMQYSGANEDRGRAEEIRAAYMQNVTVFARWLIANGYRIRFFFGDSDDEVIARAIHASLVEHSPEITPDTVILDSVETFDDVTRVIQSVSIVVATRFHNLIAAVRLGKPTLSLGYGNKAGVIMRDSGLDDFCLAARSLDAAQIIERFQELERRAPELRTRIQENTAEKARRLDDQFVLLSAQLFPPRRPRQAALKPNHTKAEYGTREEPARSGR
ncbi:MAG TPA: polysaccharide pyruvyl transferase family protein [Trebonia sp.]|nr:polysaccharide pyruvyl transferase family protein [Trebonia sp.]